MRNGFLKRKSLWLLLSVSLILFGSLRSELNAAMTLPESIPGEYVVKFRDKKISTFHAIEKSLQKMNHALGTVQVRALKTDSRYGVVKIQNKGLGIKALDFLKDNPNIEYAEPNYIYRIINPSTAPVAPDFKRAKSIGIFDFWNGDDNWGGGDFWNGGDWWGGGDRQDPWAGAPSGKTPNDPRLGELWGMYNNGQNDPKGQAGIAGLDIGAISAWGITTGSHDVVVAIIDTGVDYNHEDLVGNIYLNPGEVAGNGVDDDNNGFIDDTHGWNFADKSNDPMDDNDHGTHCAGSIGGVGNNQKGVVGVNWQVKILPIKFLGERGGGALSDALESIKYATKMRVHVMSNSWGGGGKSQAMEEAIEESRNAGVLFVAAAGNESNNNDKRPSYPAGYPIDNVISVAAMDNRGVPPSWSNYGVQTVHLGAPGVNIMSSVRNQQYGSFSGTSMACPHVAGAAALLWSANREMNALQIKERLLNTVVHTSILSQKTIAGGYLNIYNALINKVSHRFGPDHDNWEATRYALESEHNYADNMNKMWVVNIPGARYLRVHFVKIATDPQKDFVRLYDVNGQELEVFTGEYDDMTSVYAEGDTMYVNLYSDAETQGWGFYIDQVEFLR